MNINEWLETKGINPIDEITLGAIEEFIQGGQLALAMEQLEESKAHNAWMLANVLTKREQFAGFATVGLVREIDKYASLGDMKIDAYAVADEMMSDE